MKTLFLDESGDHDLISIDQDYPVFVLGGVIMDSEYSKGHVVEKLNELKLDMFGSTDIILHTADFTRNRKGFEKMENHAFRSQFYDRVNSLMSELDYSVIACAIRKNDFSNIKGVGILDTYLICLNILVEQFCYYLGKVRSQGLILTEKRARASLDLRLEVAWTNMIVQGTKNLKAKDIDKRILTLKPIAKKDNVAGLQLADLVVSPIGRHVIGKRTHRDWEIIKQKLWKNSEGIDLIILPK